MVTRQEANPNYLALFNPQTARNGSLQQTDLLKNPVFSEVVSQMDNALGLVFTGSLAEERQYAPAVFSLAVHRALQANLGDRFNPGGNREPFRIGRKIIGHSVGENLMFVGGGVIDLEPMARILDIRERITTGHLVGLEDIPDFSKLKESIGSGITFMAAVLNVDPYLLAKRIEDAGGKLMGDKIEVAMANFNSYRQAVVGFRVQSESEIPEALRAVIDLVSDNPRVRAIKLKAQRAFHTKLIEAEGALLRAALAYKGMKSHFRSPDPGIEIYSPMLNGRVMDADQAFYVVKHQLDMLNVELITTLAKIPREGLKAVVTTDVTEGAIKMVRDNLGSDMPIYNIMDLASLEQVSETLSRSLLATGSPTQS